MTAPRTTLSLVHIAAALVLFLVLSGYTHDVARWLACADAEDTCTDTVQRDAAMVATMVTGFAALFAGAHAAARTDTTREQVWALVAGAMAGAFLAMLKAAEGPLSTPEAALLERPAFVFGVTLAVGVAVIFHDRANSLSVIRHAALAALIGGCVGGLWQTGGLALLGLAGETQGYVKFALAPLAPVMAGAVFGAILLRLRAPHVPHSHILVWCLAGCIAAAIWTLMLYLPAHNVEGGWVKKDAVPAWQVGVLYTALLCAGVLVVGILGLLRPASFTGTAVLPALLPLMALCGLAGFWLGGLAHAGGFLTRGAAVSHAIAFAAVPGLTVLSLWLASLVADRIAALGTTAPPAPDS